MAGELTQQETEQFYDISASFDEYDPGLDAYIEAVRRGEAFLNRNGGYDSISYHGTLIQLNDQWEYLDQSAKVTGKVYVLDDGIVELAPGEWVGPLTDARGTYFTVEEAELVSVGILDANASRYISAEEHSADGRPVHLAFGFNPDDLESDMPMFYAAPDDILRMKYELPTLDAIASRLHRDWPDEMEALDRRIGKAAYDPMRLVKKLRKSIEDMQEQLRGPDDFRLNIARYIYHSMELDRSWPYGVTIEGPTFYAEAPDSTPESIVFKSPALQYLKSAGVSVQEYRNVSPTRVELSITFAVPSSLTDGESVEGHLVVPLSSIKGMFSTRPMGSISESVGLARDARQRDLMPEEADVVLPEPVPEKRVHPKIIEYRRLVGLEELLSEVQRKTKDVQRVRHYSPDDALEMSTNVATWFHNQVQLLELERTDLMRVSGPGVVKANGIYSNKMPHFSIDIDQENPIINPTAAADTVGCYEGMIAEIDEFEDDDGRKFWQAAPKLALTLSEVSQPLVKQAYPLLSVAIKSSALARLDDKTLFEIPDLDAMRRRHRAMTKLAAGQPDQTDLKEVRSMERAFYNETPDAWTETRRILKTIRRIAERVDEQTNKELFDAFKEQLVGRRIEIDADTWFANGRSLDHHNVGVVTDMFNVELPDGSKELVINVANGTGTDDAQREKEAAALVILRTATMLRF